MELMKRKDGWWIDGADPYFVDGSGPHTNFGPYHTKQAAAHDLRGLRAFERVFSDDSRSFPKTSSEDSTSQSDARRSKV